MPDEAPISGSWSPETYEEIADQYEPIAAELVDRIGPTATDRVLDIGCGVGHVAIEASAAGATVIGLDVNRSMLDAAREGSTDYGRAVAHWLQGEATQLPVASDQFDATLSSLGHLYAQPATAAAAELTRVTAPRGRIGFAAWSPDSAYAAIATALIEQLDVPESAAFDHSPFRWGDPAAAKQLLGNSVRSVESTTDVVLLPTASAGDFWAALRARSGLVQSALARIDDPDESAITAVIERYIDDTTGHIELEYRLITGRVRPQATA